MTSASLTRPDTPSFTAPLPASPLARVAGAGVAVAGVVVLAGWMFDVPLLRQLAPGASASMNPVTALLFAIAGASLGLLHARRQARYRLALVVAGAFIAVVGGAVLFHVTLPGGLAVDRVLFDAAMRATPDGRDNLMAPASAANFLFIGSAILLLARRARSGDIVAQACSLAVLLLAMIAMLGHMFQGGWFETIGTFSRMARHTAVGFVLLGVGLLAVRTRDGLINVLVSDGPGGTLARVMLPAALLVPPVLGWLLLRSRLRGLVMPGVGEVLFVLTTCLVFTTLVLFIADKIEQLDALRRLYQEQLEAAGEALEAQQRDLLEANERLEALATLDGLTQIRNRRAFEERLVEEVARARRYDTPLALLLIDIDHFKPFNDAYGHLAGDAVLCSVAAILRETLRETDLPARYGGEEFAILLPDTSPDDAWALAERVRWAIAREPWRERAITVSVGVASFGETVATGRALVGEADRALYRSKDEGRNRVSVAESTEVAAR
jgi:diguanylate cyclase (GGDEF)-like protein